MTEVAVVTRRVRRGDTQEYDVIDIFAPPTSYHDEARQLQVNGNHSCREQEKREANVRFLKSPVLIQRENSSLCSRIESREVM